VVGKFFDAICSALFSPFLYEFFVSLADVVGSKIAGCCPAYFSFGCLCLVQIEGLYVGVFISVLPKLGFVFANCLRYLFEFADEQSMLMAYC
tara:strand:+ start:563 stop:838 length:276 start_codon:yes stop_codon:yes gene_type:complete